MGRVWVDHTLNLLLRDSLVSWSGLISSVGHNVISPSVNRIYDNLNQVMEVHGTSNKSIMDFEIKLPQSMSHELYVVCMNGERMSLSTGPDLNFA